MAPMKTPDALPDDIDQLKAMILQLQEAAAQKESELKALEDKYQALLERNCLLNHTSQPVS